MRHVLRVTVAANQGALREGREGLADLGQILRRAVARGEINDDYAALAIDLIYGSMWYRLIFRIGPLDYTWADEVAAAIAAHG